MKIVLDIETIQATREEWAKLLGVELVSPAAVAPHAEVAGVMAGHHRRTRRHADRV